MKGSDAKTVVKQMISVVKGCVAKAKFKIMVTTLTMLADKKKFRVSAISDKINDAIDGIMSKRRQRRVVDEEDSYVEAGGALILYENSYTRSSIHSEQHLQVDDDDDQYPDLRHSLFDEEEEEKLEEELQDLLASGVDPNANNAGSVIEMAKNSKENFDLEAEIDEVADLFITKFHRRMRLQKLLSFKRNQQMLERSA